jgi:polyhydroxybutyrate depolymerase
VKPVRWALLAVALLVALVVVTALAAHGRVSERSKTFQVAGASAQPIQQTVTSGGRERKYWLYRPDSAASSVKGPLEVVINARGFPPVEMAEYTRLSDREGIVLAFPVSNADWRVQSELNFVSDVIGDAVAKQNLDEDRVYVTGGSGSGFMAFRMACSSVGRGIAGVGGLFAGIITNSQPPAGIAETCKPPHPMSIIEVHGTRDPYVPYDGRSCRVSDSGNYVCLPSQAQLMAFWASVNGCAPTPATSTSGKLKTETWRSCRNSTAVELATVVRGGHSSRSLTVDGISPQARIWEFFKAHPGGLQATKTQLKAQLLTVRVTREGSERRVVVRAQVNVASAAKLSLIQRGKAVVSAKFRPPQGTSTLQLAVPKGVKSGRYTLRLLVQSGGRSQVLTRVVSIPA